MELLNVYDGEGKRIDKVVERGSKDEAFDKNEHIGVAVIYIENDKGEFLI